MLPFGVSFPGVPHRQAGPSAGQGMSMLAADQLPEEGSARTDSQSGVESHLQGIGLNAPLLGSSHPNTDDISRV